jgi:hypothetical protein
MRLCLKKVALRNGSQAFLSFDSYLKKSDSLDIEVNSICELNLNVVGVPNVKNK